jgi:acyl-coenzyme A synthetase/AMP-(fatty) acid ligase
MAEAYPARPALQQQDRIWSYEQLHHDVAKLAAELDGRVGQGDVVISSVLTTHAAIVVLLAAGVAEAAVLPVLPGR